MQTAKHYANSSKYLKLEQQMSSFNMLAGLSADFLCFNLFEFLDKIVPDEVMLGYRHAWSTDDKSDPLSDV